MEIWRIILPFVLAVVSAYLIGSINFAIIVSKIFAKKDIRDYGSGNAGMTNVLRTFGKVPAILTTVGDFFKGVLAVWLGRYIIVSFGAYVPEYADYLVALPALLGHCFPVFHQFKGGKGILVSAGIIFMLNPWILLIILTVFGVVVALSRMVSLASISAAVAFPISTLIYGLALNSSNVLIDTILAILMAAMVIFMHRSNIERIKNGTESKLFEKKK